MDDMEFSQNKSFHFVWTIKNFPCVLDYGRFALESPTVAFEELQRTSWFIRYYPRVTINGIVYTKWELCRAEQDDGPEEVSVHVQISVSKVNWETILPGQLGEKNMFRNGTSVKLMSLTREELLQAAALSLYDTLGVMCELRRVVCNDPSEVIRDTSEVIRSYGSTNIHADWNYFKWTLKYSSDGNWLIYPLNRGVKSTSVPSANLIPTLSKVSESRMIRLAFEIEPFIKEVPDVYLFRLYLVDVQGSYQMLSTQEIAAKDYEEMHAFQFVKTLSWNEMINLRGTRFSNEDITLEAELVTSFGVVIKSSVEKPQVKDDIFKKRTETDRPETSLINSLRTLYEKGTASDVRLRTATKTFPAHRAILSVRSPVFEKMFTEDTQESETKSVDVSDVDADTMDRFLLYVYIEKVTEMNWDTAKKLYYCADKYQMLDLKKECATYLRNNLSIKNVCDILVLSEMHRDNEMKPFVLDFIAQYKSDILSSEEWRRLEKERANIAIEALREAALD